MDPGAHVSRLSRSHAAMSRPAVRARMASRTVVGRSAAVVVEHLAHEEGVAAGDPMQPGRVDVAITHQRGHGLQAQRRHDQGLRVRGACDVTEQRPQRMGDADLVVAGDADHQQAESEPRAAQQKPEQVDGALIGPLQVVENQDRRLRSELVEHRREDVVGLIAVTQQLRSGGPELVGEVVQRSQRPRRGQRVAAPHSTRASPSNRPTNASTNDVLPRAGLAAHHHRAAASGASRGRPGRELFEFVLAFRQLHGGDSTGYRSGLTSENVGMIRGSGAGCPRRNRDVFPMTVRPQ